MSINRGPFNALVDDDGSGTRGTPWNKQQIKDVILDPVDAAITASVPSNPWVTVPFNVGYFWPGVTAAMVGLNCYTVINQKTLIWQVQLFNAPVYPGGGSYLVFYLPNNGTLFGSTAINSPATWATDNGVEVPARVGISPAGAQTLGVMKTNLAAWAGPNVSAYFTAIVGLA